MYMILDRFLLPVEVLYATKNNTFTDFSITFEHELQYGGGSGDKWMYFYTLRG